MMVRAHFVDFFIPGDPVAFARSGGGKSGVRFTPKKQRTHAGTIKHFALEGMKKYNNERPTGQPLALTVTVTYPQPKSWSKKKKAETIFKTSKPDVDNLAKLVMDACNNLVWLDDAQVAYLIVQKAYNDGMPGTHVKVEFLSGEAE